MTKKLTEIDIKARVKELRNFYVDLTLYGTVNLGLILIWAISGGGYFWPIWVIVGWGIGMLLKAISLDMIPALADVFPFFDKTWEEQQIKRLMKSQTITALNERSVVISSNKDEGSLAPESKMKTPSKKVAQKAPASVKAKPSTSKGAQKNPSPTKQTKE